MRKNHAQYGIGRNRGSLRPEDGQDGGKNNSVGALWVLLDGAVKGGTRQRQVADRKEVRCVQSLKPPPWHLMKSSQLSSPQENQHHHRHRHRRKRQYPSCIFWGVPGEPSSSCRLMREAPFLQHWSENFKLEHLSASSSLAVWLRVMELRYLFHATYLLTVGVSCCR